MDRTTPVTLCFMSNAGRPAACIQGRTNAISAQETSTGGISAVPAGSRSIGQAVEHGEEEAQIMPLTHTHSLTD